MLTAYLLTVSSVKSTFCLLEVMNEIVLLLVPLLYADIRIHARQVNMSATPPSPMPPSYTSGNLLQSSHSTCSKS